jgi:hypothetical protein
MDIWIMVFFIAYGGSWRSAIVMSRHYFGIIRQGKKFFFYGFIHYLPGPARQVAPAHSFHKQSISRKYIAGRVQTDSAGRMSRECE